MLTISRYEECVKRVEKAIEGLSKLLLSRIGGEFTLVDVLDYASTFVERFGSPCIGVEPYSREYVAFLASQLDALPKTIFNASMEATARHIERLGFGEYALLSVTLIGYAMNTMQLVGLFRDALPFLTYSELMYFEPLVFAAVLRYMSVCRLVRDQPPRRIRRLISKILASIERFSSEDSALASALRP